MSILSQVSAARATIADESTRVGGALSAAPSNNGNGQPVAKPAGVQSLLEGLQALQAQAVSAASAGILASAVAAAEQSAQASVAALAAPLLAEIQAQLATIKASADPAELRVAARAALNEEIVDPTTRCAALAGGATELKPELLPVDPHYQETDTGRAVRRWLATGRSFAYVSGPSGSGKTFPIENELRKAGRRYLLVSCSDATTRGELVGYQAASAGSSTWIDGAATLAMRHGYALILDEIGKLDPLVLASLNRVLDRAPRLRTPWGEELAPTPGFCALATGNALTDESGLFVEHRASAELPGRAAGGLILADYLPADQERAIIQAHAPSLPASNVERIVEALANLRALAKRGMLSLPASLRTGISVAQDGADVHGAGALSWQDAWNAAILHGLKPSERDAAIVAIGGAA